MHVRDETENVLVEVEDHGPGIPRADRNRIFERFYKVDRARSRGRGGTGLGLAIARHIVDRHRGHIWVQSEEGRGVELLRQPPKSGLEQRCSAPRTMITPVADGRRDVLDAVTAAAARERHRISASSHCHESEASPAAAANTSRSPGSPRNGKPNGQRGEVHDRRRIEQRQSRAWPGTFGGAVGAPRRARPSARASRAPSAAASRPRTPNAIRIAPPTTRSGSMSGPMNVRDPQAGERGDRARRRDPPWPRRRPRRDRRAGRASGPSG